MQSIQQQPPPSPHPRLRDDLRILPFKDSEGDGYVIEDPLRNTYYKIGQREYQFLCYLDRGGRLESLPEDPSDDDNSVTQEEGETILKWLVTKQLLQKMGHEVLQMLENQQKISETKSWYNRFNLITFKIPLVNPDPLLTHLMPWIGWLTGPLFFVIWGILAATALITLATHFQDFTSQSVIFFSPQNLLIVGGIWILLKLLHEFAHAITCRRYGGRVYEAGILFILFFPLTYVNATSSWSFSNRWQRIHVTAAGILVELFVAWVAILFWSSHQGTAAGLIAHHTVIIAGVSSLLFNANPLMRFDGYYLLSDLVSLPNLYFLGIEAVKNSAKKWWLGIGEVEESSQNGPWIRLYGLSVYSWRVLVLASLSILSASMFSGWGIIFAAVALIAWIYPPIAGFIKQIPNYKQQNPKVIQHFLMRLGIAGVLSAICLFGFKWERTLLAPAVVIYEQQHSIRTGTAGFIEETFIKEGELVSRGQRLFKLTNNDLLSKYRELEIKLKIFDLQERKADSEGSYGQLQILSQQKKVVEEQKGNLKDDLDALIIHAPDDGVVVGKNLLSLEGMWAPRGKELCQIINQEQTGLVASIEQDDISSYPTNKGDRIMVDMAGSGYGVFFGSIDRIVPTASTELVHFSLAAPFSGSLDVKPSTTKDKNGYELLSPRISMYIDLPSPIRQKLKDGQQAFVHISGTKESLGTIFFRAAKSWVVRKQQQIQ